MTVGILIPEYDWVCSAFNKPNKRGIDKCAHSGSETALSTLDIHVLRGGGSNIWSFLVGPESFVKVRRDAHCWPADPTSFHIGYSRVARWGQ